ncbi:MAG: serine hydrolase, partial [Gemmatimonadaceae bacterium]
AVFEAICAQVPEPPARANEAANSAVPPAPPLTPFQRCVAQRAGQPVGLRKTLATAAGDVLSNVDELYRLALGLEVPRTYARNASADPGVEREPIDVSKGWDVDTYRGATRYRAFGLAGGKRSAFVRIPQRHTTIIILTNDDTANAKGMADQIAERVLGGR